LVDDGRWEACCLGPGADPRRRYGSIVHSVRISCVGGPADAVEVARIRRAAFRIHSSWIGGSVGPAANSSRVEQRRVVDVVVPRRSHCTANAVNVSGSGGTTETAGIDWIASRLTPGAESTRLVERRVVDVVEGADSVITPDTIQVAARCDATLKLDFRWIRRELSPRSETTQYNGRRINSVRGD